MNGLYLERTLRKVGTYDLSKKVCLVTGAAGGIGRAIVSEFLACHAQVVATDLNAPAVTTRSDALLPLSHDVTSEASWITVLDSVERQYGTLDVLVNCAGHFEPHIAFEEMTLEQWRAHFSVNSEGVFLGCKHGLRRMRRLGGSIINIGSGMSVRPTPDAAAYCGSKAAAWMTTRTAALAGGKYGIRVNAVLPGAVPTDMLRRNLRAGQHENDLFGELATYAALGVLASAADIAQAVAFLAHDGASRITGIALPVDAGNLN